MTDFDLKPEQHQILSEAIFGGPKPTLVHVRKWARHVGLTWPQAVMTVRLPEDILSTRKQNSLKKLDVRLLNLHAGLLYIFTDSGKTTELEQRIAKLFKLASKFHHSEHPASWVHSIQQSIINLRQLELNLVQDNPDSQPPSLQEEIDTRRLAIVRVQQHEPHWQETVELWLRIVLLRHRNHLHDVRRKIVEFISGITRPSDVQAQLSFVFTQAIERLYATHAFSDFQSVVLHAVTDLRVYLPTDTLQADSQSLLVRRAIAVLHEQASEPLSLRDVAKLTHVSASHLAREFRKQTGIPVTTYLHQLRVTMAKRQLIESDETILSIAINCGFESVEHFHRIFKRYTDMTPRRYRVSHQV